MTEMSENNKTIAIFMGLNPCDDREEYHSTLYTNVTDDLIYHKSWDVLMPVIEEIEVRHQGVPQQLLCLTLFSTIQEVHGAVVEFIKLYNKETK